MPYEVPKATPKQLFQAMLARTATAGPRRRHVLPRPGEEDFRFGEMEPVPGGQPGSYQRQPKPTATSVLGVEGEEGATMTEGPNAPRVKAKRVKKRDQEEE